MASRGDRRREMPAARFGPGGAQQLEGGGSVYSDVASDDGRNGNAYVTGSRSSSFKAQNLASEIANIEQRCDYLEQRNKWLTEKLLGNQRQFIERTMVGSSKTVLQHALKAWAEALELLRYEKQLQQQTEDARKCQQVAKELGAALAREQEVCRNHQEMRQQIEAQFDEVVEANSMLKQNADKQAVQISSLQRQVSLIMGGLERNKSEAESIVDSVDEIQKKMRELKRDDVNPGPTASSGNVPDAIEESVNLRAETQSLMNSMSGLLQQQNSPERERRQIAGMKYQPSRLADGDRGGYGRSAEGRVQSANQSPLDTRFQTVNQIVAELEQAPTLTSGNDVLRAGSLGTRISDVSNLGQAGTGTRSSFGQSAGERSPIFGRQAALSSVSAAGRR